MLKLRLIPIVAGLGAMIFASGCSSKAKKADADAGSPAFYAVSVLAPTKGRTAKGTVKFAEAFGKVRIEGEVSGLQKNLEHGFHIHQFGDCSASDGSSAGGHYNPGGHQHAGPNAEARHAGDLGNILADAKGVAKFSFTVEGISINTGANPIIGRGLIVHENKDDLISQPTGGAGARLACGVIGVAEK